MTSGYLIVLNAIALITRRRYQAGSIILLVALILTWAIGGGKWENHLWSYVTALPIALACGATAWEAHSSVHLRA
jgi:predicted Co/Zn/Cd cation transporter (cation efflux family)